MKVCAVDASTGWCLGCGRTLKEIGQWIGMGEVARESVLGALPARIGRLEALGKR